MTAPEAAARSVDERARAGALPVYEFCVPKPIGRRGWRGAKTPLVRPEKEVELWERCGCL